jgi:glycosyltransferase involved in cell wall biosynthesis
MKEPETSSGNLELSVVIPVFVEGPEAVPSIVERIDSYHILASLYGGTEIIIVNDGSCPELGVELHDRRDYEHLVVHELPRAGDWTQPRARNIGLQSAKGKKILFTDIDHLIPPMTLAGMLQMKLAPGKVTKFRRKIMGQGDTHPHPGTLLLLNDKPRYWEERFCGNYGSDDIWWMEYHGLKEIVTDYLMLVNLGDHHNLDKDSEINKELISKLRKERPKPEVTTLEDVYEGYSSNSNNEKV